MANPHGTSVCCLPLRIQNLTCSCPNRSEAIRLCLGCYRHYCLSCFKEHRRQISAQLGHIIHESDLVLQVILLTSEQHDENTVFNPVQLRKNIDDFHDKLINEVKHTTRRALQSLRGLMDERSDHLVSRIKPITTSQLQSWKDFKNYISAHWERYREELRAANDHLEEELNTTILVSMDRARDIDWRHLIELQHVRKRGSKRNPPIGIMKEAHFEHLAKVHQPFKSIENQERGNAIAASDHLIIYARNDDEVCIVEAHAGYTTIIPLLDDIDPSERPADIVDLCWSSTTGVFIVLTHTQLLTLSPNRKIPTLVPDIRPPDRCSFCNCTCSGDKFLLSYRKGKNSSIQEWSVTDWRQTRCWSPSEVCDEGQNILCMRITLNGSFIGMTLTSTKKADRFEVRNVDTMICVWSRDIPATNSIGIVPFTEAIWIVGAFCHHKLFLLDKNKELIQEIIMTDPLKSSLRGITLVDQGTVVIRTAKTVIFFDLFN